MKAKLIFSTESKNHEYWTDMPFIPRINELVNIGDILFEEEIRQIQQSSHHWAGLKGIIQSVEYRHDDNDFYTELIIWCED
jgi:hypothetical protein